MSEKDPRTQTLLGVRLTFTDGIAEKKVPRNAEPGTKPKHNTNIILESGSKHHAANMAKVKTALEAAGEVMWKDPNRYKTIAEDNPKRVTFKKGERFKNKEGKVYAGYEGNHAFSASGPGGGERRPILKDKYKRDVAEKDIRDVFYSGTYADVVVSFFGTEKGSAGVFASVEVIRSHQIGERMAGGYAFDESDLDEMEDFDDDGIDDLGAAPAKSETKPSASDDVDSLFD